MCQGVSRVVSGEPPLHGLTLGAVWWRGEEDGQEVHLAFGVTDHLEFLLGGVGWGGVEVGVKGVEGMRWDGVGVRWLREKARRGRGRQMGEDG